LLQIATVDEVRHILAKKSASDLLKMIDIFIETMDKYRNATNIHSYFEVALLKMMAMGDEAGIQVTVKAESPVLSLKKPIVEAVQQETQPTSSSESIEDDMEVNADEPIVQSDEDDRLLQLDIGDDKVETADTEELLLTDFDIVRLMVAGDKARRTQDATLWNRLDEFINEIEWAKVARMIVDGSIVVSNEQFVVISLPYEEIVREINAKSNETSLRKLMNEVLKQPRKVFAITKEQEERSVALFRELWSAKKLPEPMIVHAEPLPKAKKQEEDVSVDQRLVSLFGEGNVDFIHEE
jgi:DNA polymerase-3 subunit gamma/tau